MNLSDLKPDPKNPRSISEEALKGLGYSIEEFGDLSGITFNNKSGNIVSGHQRVKSLQETYGDLEIVKGKIKVPDKDVEFKVRTVSWSRKKERAANIAANNPHITGTFTSSALPILEKIKLDSLELFTELNLEPLKLDLDTNLPCEPEEGQNKPGEGEEWVKFEVGGKVGVVHKDVYNLFCSEFDRLSGIVESKEITPILEAMVANSAGTPEESLK